MVNETTFVILTLVVFLVGVIMGTIIFYFLRQKFENETHKLLLNQTKKLQELLSSNIIEVNKEFKSYINEFSNISNETLTIQNNIKDSLNLTNNNLAKFHKEIYSAHHIRQSLENEIVKLKNIINRLNKQKKEQ